MRRAGGEGLANRARRVWRAKRIKAAVSDAIRERRHRMNHEKRRDERETNVKNRAGKAVWEEKRRDDMRG